MKKLLLIVNPNAGRKRAGSALMKIVSGFANAGYEVTVYPTAMQGDAEAKAFSASVDYDLTVCYGGDGTLSETINGLARINDDTTPAFSFITEGTSNDFARTVNMPAVIEKAVNKIVCGKNTPLDLGQFNERNFIYVAAFGLYTSVSYIVPQEAKKAFGHLAYVAEGAKQTFTLPSHKMKITYDDQVIEGDFSVGLVANTASVAGMFKIERSVVKLDDGKFELILVRNPGNPILLSKIIMDLSVWKFHPDYVIFAQPSKIAFESDEDVAWCLDGENGGLHKTVQITNLYKKGNIRI